MCRILSVLRVIDMDSSVVYQMFTELSVEDQRDFLNMINSQPEIPDNDFDDIRDLFTRHSNGQFNIQKINSYHNELKRLVNRHFKGVATKYLNNYVVYNNFVNWAKGSFYTLLGVLKDFVYTTVCNTKGYKIVLRRAIPH